MKWSFRLVRIAGIDVKVHWTFAMLLVWMATANMASGKSLAESALGIAFVLAIFGCVLLHEFGHALTARRFGIKTADITLLPIGGVARLERMPEDPKQEFLIAIAGPLVNVAIAAVLFLLLAFSGGLKALPETLDVGAHFWYLLLSVNVVLVVFNMIPAFPMDGGRVLRSILARKMEYARATEIAANVGQIIAILFGILGFFFNWFLMFIALFVYLGAQAEAQMAFARVLLSGVRVRDAMMTRFVAVSPHDPLKIVVEHLLAGDQQDFPVVESQRVVGIVRRKELIQAITTGKVDAPIETIMQTDCAPVDENAPLRDTFEIMQQTACRAIPVIGNGRLVGLLTQDNIAEWMMIRTAHQDFNAR